MEFAFHGTVPPELEEFRAGLEAALIRRGYTMLASPDDATLVCNFVDAADARPYRRTNKWTFVASFWYAQAPPDDFVRTGYPVLLKALSNLSVCVVPGTMARGSISSANCVRRCTRPPGRLRATTGASWRILCTRSFSACLGRMASAAPSSPITMAEAG